MTIRFACRCGKKMKASDDKIGTKILCPECGSPVKIPESNTIRKETVASGVAASELAGNLLRGSGSNKTPSSEFGTQASNQISFETQDKKPKINYDFVGSLVSFLKTVVPATAAVILLVGTTYWISSSMMRKKMKIPELAPVHGVIKLDGTPLANATVFFESKKASSGSKIATAMGKTDRNGRYEIIYLNDYPGGVIGPNKVRIQATDKNGRSLIASEYAGQTTLTAEVALESENEFNFELEPY